MVAEPVAAVLSLCHAHPRGEALAQDASLRRWAWEMQAIGLWSKMTHRQLKHDREIMANVDKVHVKGLQTMTDLKNALFELHQLYARDISRAAEMEQRRSAAGQPPPPSSPPHLLAASLARLLASHAALTTSSLRRAPCARLAPWPTRRGGDKAWRCGSGAAGCLSALGQSLICPCRHA